MSYRRTYRRSSSAPRAGRWMELRYAGHCAGPCGRDLPAGTRAFYDPRDRTVTCTELDCADAMGLTTDKWIGSPASGGFVKVLSETRHLPGHSWSPDGTHHFAGCLSGGRCEDYPCCGH